ncbi:DUF6731 family protein [Leuconostoc gelidum]|uniref:DUF4868 domain-containing protein n=1 Tax=Leuconostoc gelidum subsp. gelidum TaxID=1607839 RepID=A0AB35FYJ4_LEUGE|nr:DUF6731 family protein [Leuconostoc gelidum]MBZ6015415.1 hypothetical protein [Leuconostoc gelidum subsp. gelidum]
MASKTQEVYFEAYQAYTVKDDNEMVLNIANLLRNIDQLPFTDRKVDYFGENVTMNLIHDVRFDRKRYTKLNASETLTYFHMTKSRDEGIATTKSDEEALNFLDLDEDEYLAEDIGCFFDSDLCMLFIQRNFHSLSVRGLTAYLSDIDKRIQEIKEDFDETNFNKLDIEFRPVVDKKQMSKILKNDKFSKVTLGFASDKRVNMPKGLSKILGIFGDGFDDLDAPNIKIELTAKKDQSGLNHSQTKDLITEAQKNLNLFTTLVVNGKNGENPIEKYDLINGKLRTSHKFSSVQNNNGKARKMHLDPASVEDIMKLLYLGIGDKPTLPFRDKIIENLN